VKVDGVDYSNPNRFTLRQRIILAIVPVVFAWVYRLLAATWRYEVRNRERLDELTRREGVALFGVWHECIAPFLHLHKGRGVHSAASQSFDGELAARVLRRFQIGIVRGSSSRGGGFALENLLKAAPHVPAIGLTIDGPRGPRRVAKPGIAILAARLRKPLLVSAVSAAPVWRLRSWDRMMIPKPYARLVCDFSEEIPPPPTDSPEDVEAVRLHLEAELNRMHDALDAELGTEA
jgi:lysophospholipid acyltransferase (LPLAT)-like uncharacterized protein